MRHIVRAAGVLLFAGAAAAALAQKRREYWQKVFAGLGVKPQ